MRDVPANPFDVLDRERISRRQLLQALSVAAVGAPLAAALGQGRCQTALGSPACVTTPIAPLFEPAPWKTVALDHIVITVADYKAEAAFYEALMGWKLRSDDGKQAVMDMASWGSCIFRAAPAAAPAPAPDTAGGGGRGGRGGGRGGAARAAVTSFCFAIDPWDAKKVEAELKKRGLTPVAENDGKGFESFHVKDPDGWDLQISNANGLVKARKASAANAKHSVPMPFESTGWKTIWLDHFSFQVTNYKESASFYQNLMRWDPTYDEGSQHELMMADIGDILVRGGNPLAPAGAGGRGARRDSTAAAPPPPPPPSAPVQLTRRPANIDHISFGIAPWDVDAVRAELEKRGLNVQVDTSSVHWDATAKRYVSDEIHTAPFRSYHTRTPNGYNLQISWVTKETRLALPNAVRPKPPGGPGGSPR